jgi:translation initiation factor 2 beta subunit (eIF-2beta)/eIF-5
LQETAGHVAYKYEDMLDRISQMLRDNNLDLLESSSLGKKESPNVLRLGTTKTNWANFDSMVNAIDRTHEHLMSFIATELGAEASLGPENNMILQGKYQGKNIGKDKI